MKKFFLFVVVAFISAIGWSQIPAGYYDGTQGLTGDALRMKLRQIISNGHTQNSYDNLYVLFRQTDNWGGDTVWDPYSIKANGTANYWYRYNHSQECGTYNSEGDCYNREHSIPQSWFNGNYPMYADLFILYPTDGYVNNRRSNYPYGQVGNTTWTSTNGSKLGSSNFPGYTGTVFEPIDAYKGDFARTYFYAVTRYDVSSWSGDSFSGDNLSAWTKNLFLKWDSIDPVSPKEIARNNAAYTLQHNRNPYIDHPEFVKAVFLGILYAPENELPEISVTPNPSADFINIGVLTQYPYTIALIDQTGRKVMAIENATANTSVDIHALENGIYFIMLEGKGFSTYKKFVKIGE